MHIPWLSLIAATAVIPQNGNALVFGFSFNSSFLLFPSHASLLMPGTPFFCSSMSMIVFFCQVENNGFEPLTPCVQSRCSSQLS